MEVKGIIFDCDGILVDSEKLSCGIFAEMMREKGAKVTDEEVLLEIKGTSIHHSLTYAAELIPRLNKEDFEAEYRKKSFAAFRVQMKPVRGVEKVLQTLPFPKAIVSNGPSSKVLLNLTTAGLIGYFDPSNIFSGHDFGRFKPDPYVLFRAAKQLGVDPRNCVVIEDSPHGAEAAKRAGMKCYGYTEQTDPAKFVEWDAIPFRRMEELISQLL